MELIWTIVKYAIVLPAAIFIAGYILFFIAQLIIALVERVRDYEKFGY